MNKKYTIRVIDNFDSMHIMDALLEGYCGTRSNDGSIYLTVTNEYVYTFKFNIDKIYAKFDLRKINKVYEYIINGMYKEDINFEMYTSQINSISKYVLDFKRICGETPVLVTKSTDKQFEKINANIWWWDN